PGNRPLRPHRLDLPWARSLAFRSFPGTARPDGGWFGGHRGRYKPAHGRRRVLDGSADGKSTLPPASAGRSWADRHRGSLRVRGIGSDPDRAGFRRRSLRWLFGLPRAWPDGAAGPDRRRRLGVALSARARPHAARRLDAGVPTRPG